MTEEVPGKFLKESYKEFPQKTPRRKTWRNSSWNTKKSSFFFNSWWNLLITFLEHFLKVFLEHWVNIFQKEFLETHFWIYFLKNPREIFINILRGNSGEIFGKNIEEGRKSLKYMFVLLQESVEEIMPESLRVIM